VDETATHSSRSSEQKAYRVAQIRAAGVISYGEQRAADTAAPGTVNAWSSALERWSRDAETYGVVVRHGDGAFPPVRQGDRLSTDELRQIYSLIWRQDCFFKPTVALLNGETSASALALSVAGTHQVAGPNFSFRLPWSDESSTTSQPTPLFGLEHIYASLPASIGTYLVLTGATLSQADAFHFGLVTHCIDEPVYEILTESLADAEPVDDVLDRHHRDPGVGRLTPYRGTIERCFASATIDEICARLDLEPEPARAFAQATKHRLDEQNKVDLSVRLSRLRRASAFEFRMALIEDFAALVSAEIKPLELVSRQELQVPHT
jgi:enoyl-CoA hydratase